MVLPALALVGSPRERLPGGPHPRPGRGPALKRAAGAGAVATVATIALLLAAPPSAAAMRGEAPPPVAAAQPPDTAAARDGPVFWPPWLATRPAPPAYPEVFVTPAWLAERYGRRDVEVLDARAAGYGATEDAMAAPGCPWRDGHVPHALPFDFAALLRDGEAAPRDFVRAAVAQAGPRVATPVNPDATFVVCADSDAGAAPGYLLLRAAGFDARVLAGGWAAWTADPALPVVRVIDAEELRDLLTAAGRDPAGDAPPPGVALIDVRHDTDFRRARIGGAVNVMAQDAADSLAVVLARAWPGLDPARDPVVVYCYGPECIRSREAATLLARLGWRRPLWFHGGMREWQEAGGPVVRDPARP